jgi:hypothetical protein
MGPNERPGVLNVERLANDNPQRHRCSKRRKSWSLARGAPNGAQNGDGTSGHRQGNKGRIEGRRISQNLERVRRLAVSVMKKAMDDRETTGDVVVKEPSSCD